MRIRAHTVLLLMTKQQMIIRKERRRNPPTNLSSARESSCHPSAPTKVVKTQCRMKNQLLKLRKKLRIRVSQSKQGNRRMNSIQTGNKVIRAVNKKNECMTNDRQQYIRCTLLGLQILLQEKPQLPMHLHEHPCKNMEPGSEGQCQYEGRSSKTVRKCFTQQ